MLPVLTPGIANTSLGIDSPKVTGTIHELLARYLVKQAVVFSAAHDCGLCGLTTA